MNPSRTLGNDPTVDTSIWATALDRVGGIFRSLTNEFLHICQAVLEEDGGSNSYEKSVGIDEVLVHARSNYSQNIHKDGVGRDRRAIIAVTDGRGWGGYDEVEFRPNCTGHGVGCEVAIRNNSGVEQPELDTPQSSYGHLHTATGNGMGSCISYAPGHAGAPSHHNGWVVRQNAIPQGRGVWEIRKSLTNDRIYQVDSGGNVVCQEFRPSRTFPRFVLSPDKPILKPGEDCIWGETDTGIIRHVFFDGGNYFASQMEVL